MVLVTFGFQAQPLKKIRKRAPWYFLHVVAQLALLGLIVQPSKCVTWSPSGLEVFAVLPKGVSHAIDCEKWLQHASCICWVVSAEFLIGQSCPRS